MHTAERHAGRMLTADEFLTIDQREFGDAWRYELVDGAIIAHAAPSPERGAILASLTIAVGNRLRGHPDTCRIETGSGAAPRRQQRNTARIPDAMIRCGEQPRVVFEVVSPSELRAWRARNRKRRDEQEVEGVQEIVEIYEGEASAHMYRREADGRWSVYAVDGLDAVLRLESVNLDISLAEIYETVELAGEEEGETDAA
ncbi:MAG TPA: Uma2 family endonuclease [Rhodopila sp.]|nr:Uma2 family endonuclease [Rhodopila sp.]